MSAGEASTPPSLLDEIRAEVIGSSHGCLAGDFLAEHPDLAAAVQEAIGEGIPRAAIGRFLVKKGYQGRPNTIKRHLQGNQCSCRTS